MRILDTNVVIRVLTADDKAQALRARALIEEGDVVLLLTVALEAAWVLRSHYGFPRAAVVAGLKGFMALPGVVAEDPARLRLALDLAAQGFDLADALHLAATPPGSTFLTFDRDLLRRAQALGLPAREP